MTKWIAAGIWMTVILVLSTIHTGSGGSEFWPNVVHFTEYGILGLLLLRAINATWNIQRKKSSIYAVAVATIYGISMEVVQLFLPYRSFSITDMLVNFTGATVAILVIKLIKAGELMNR